MSSKPGRTEASPLAALPRDARAVVLILDSMGVKQFEPRVVTQLLEFGHRYTSDVLGDAKVYSEHAGKSVVDGDDVRLAIQSRVNISFSQPPPREMLLELGRVRNAVPLPPIATTAGIPLPPPSECLAQRNYQIHPPSSLAHASQGSRKRPGPVAESQEEGEREERGMRSGTSPGGEGAAKLSRNTSIGLATGPRPSVTFALKKH